MSERIRYSVVRSKRKTISIKVKEDLSVEVRAPLTATDAEIQKIVEKHAVWIANARKKLEALRENKKNEETDEDEDSPILSAGKKNHLTDAELIYYRNQAAQYFPKKVEEYAPLVGVTVNRIAIKNMRSRWGSCSSKGNLNFNLQLMRFPEWIRDYVVIHELCHRKEMNHSSRFWAEVEKVMPNYKEARAWLREKGTIL